MNYKKIYNDIMEKSKSENRIKHNGIYYEAHHIIPKCLGGKGNCKQWETHPNIVLLTAKEHFIAHKLLCEIYPDNHKLIYAYWNFVNGRNDSNHKNKFQYKIGSREYERIKILRSKLLRNEKLLSIEEFIEKSKKVHKDKYDYSLVDYQGRGKKVTIICKKHGEFRQTPHSHMSQRGCSECGKEKSRSALIGRKKSDETIKKITEKTRSNSEEFIEKSKKVHGDKYDYSLVDYVNAITKVKIVCKIHGDFEQTPNTHLGGGGCKKCGTIKVAEFHKNREQEYRKIKQLTKDGELIKVWDNINDIVDELKCTRCSIYGCAQGKRKSGKGFKWEYV